MNLPLAEVEAMGAHVKVNSVGTENPQKCSKCGYFDNHRIFPASEANCHICQKIGHFWAMRRSSGIHQTEEVDDNYTHLINIAANKDGINNPGDVIGGKTTNHKTTNCTRKMMKLNRGLQSCTGHRIKVEGRITFPTRYKDKTLNILYFVVHADRQHLLSGNACKRLGQPA